MRMIATTIKRSPPNVEKHLNRCPCIGEPAVTTTPGPIGLLVLTAVASAPIIVEVECMSYAMPVQRLFCNDTAGDVGMVGPYEVPAGVARTSAP
jgi:hypothetical protein